MTVEDFYMRAHPYISGTVVEIIAAEGSVKSELEVSILDFEDALNDMKDYLFDWIMQQLEPRVTNAYDDDLITSEELEAYRKIMKVIEW